MGVVGTPFISFGFVHVVSAVTVLCLAFGLPLLIARTASPRQQDLFRIILIALVLAQLVINPWLRVNVYGEPLRQNLPLHLCHLSLILGTVTLLFRNYPAYEVAYFWALGGAIPAILMPDVEYTYPHPFFFPLFWRARPRTCLYFVRDLCLWFPASIGVGRQGDHRNGCTRRICVSDQLYSGRQLSLFAPQTRATVCHRSHGPLALVHFGAGSPGRFACIAVIPACRLAETSCVE